MDKEELKHRMKQFALRVVRLIEALPRGRTADVLGRQLLRSGTSVGANYRAACRDKAITDSITKIEIVEEESNGSVYWMALMGKVSDRESRAKSKAIGIIDEKRK